MIKKIKRRKNLQRVILLTVPITTSISCGIMMILFHMYNLSGYSYTNSNKETIVVEGATIGEYLLSFLQSIGVAIIIYLVLTLLAMLYIVISNRFRKLK